MIEAKVEAQGKDNTKVKMKAKDNGKDVVVGVVHDGDLRQS
ncbi:hypothetical protein ACGFZ6_05580 [Stutzerimonas stutzeri]